MAKRTVRKTRKRNVVPLAAFGIASTAAALPTVVKQYTRGVGGTVSAAQRFIRNPEDIDFLNDMTPIASRGHLAFTPDGIEEFVRDGFVYQAYSNTPVFADGYRQGTPIEAIGSVAQRNPARYERCVQAVQAQGRANGYAVCSKLRNPTPWVLDMRLQFMVNGILRTIAEGTPIEIIEKKGKRVKVRGNWDGPFEGWVDKDYIRREKRNPESTAADLYEQFHGTPSTEILEVVEDLHVHGNLGGLGQLVEMYVVMPGQYKTNLKAPSPDGRDAIQVSGTEDGNNIYFRSGDQSIDVEALGFEPSISIKHEGDTYQASQIKDAMVLGYVHKLTYRTEKAFDDFETIDYYHKVGEDTKRCPMLIYDTLNSLMSFAGGEFVITPAGIVN